ncbi:MAG: hypothetical protein ACPHDX_01305, partial [Flavobacteriaceae bacterium]
MKRLLLLVTLIFSFNSLFSQDVAIGNIVVGGGGSFCPSNDVSFTVEIIDIAGGGNDISNDRFYFEVNGPINRAAANYEIKGGKNIGPGGTIVLTYPDDFIPLFGATTSTLDFSDDGGPYTLTASISIDVDTDLSNNVSTVLDIDVYDIVTPILSSNKDPGNLICADENITFTIDPYSATATYTFKVNDAVIQSLSGVNTITFSTVGIGSIADGDVVTIDMIDGNGCVTDSSTQSRTVSVSSKPNANLSSSVTDGIFCAGDSINFNASGGVSYKWYINGDEQIGASFPTFSKGLNDGDTVVVRVFNAAGCYDEESLTFNQMNLDDNGLIVLQNPSDSDLCNGQNPTGLILGDGTGGSLVASSTYGTISYQWQKSINNGTSYTNINGATAENYQPAGISTNTLFRRNVIISSLTSSCTFIGDDIVAINNRPLFDINLTTNSPDNIFCQDENIIVSSNAGAATYTFIINATTISSGSTTTLNLVSGSVRNLAASPPIIQNGDNVTVQIEDNFGCTNQETIPIIIDEVGLNPGVSTNKPGNIICFGEEIEIQASGGVSYTFYINNLGNPAIPAEVVGNTFTTNRLNDGDVVISRVFNATGCYADVNTTFTVLSLSSTGSITLEVAADSSLCYNTAMAGSIDGGNLGFGGGAASSTVASATIGYKWQSSINNG